MTITITDEEYQELIRIKREYESLNKIRKAIIDIINDPGQIVFTPSMIEVMEKLLK